jgi:hypothetical protein
VPTRRRVKPARPPDSSKDVVFGSGPGRASATCVRAQGQRPSISTSSEKLRNVLMITMPARTDESATFTRLDGTPSSADRVRRGIHECADHVDELVGVREMGNVAGTVKDMVPGVR